MSAQISVAPLLIHLGVLGSTLWSALLGITGAPDPPCYIAEVVLRWHSQRKGTASDRSR